MFRTKFSTIFALSCAALFTGCGGDESSSEPKNFDGNWSYTSKTTEENCGDGFRTYIGELSITQIAESVTIFFDGDTEGVSGSINGRVLSWRTQVQIDGGTSDHRGKLSLDELGKSAAGTVNFEWSDGDFSCSGIESVEINCESGFCLEADTETEAEASKAEFDKLQKLACFKNYSMQACTGLDGGNFGNRTFFDVSNSCEGLGFEEAQVRDFSGSIPGPGTTVGTCAVYSAIN